MLRDGDFGMCRQRVSKVNHIFVDMSLFNLDLWERVIFSFNVDFNNNLLHLLLLAGVQIALEAVRKILRVMFRLGVLPAWMHLILFSS